MSLILELAGTVGAMLMEYAIEKKWHKTKAFLITCASFFLLFSLHPLIFAVEGRRWIGMMIALGLSMALGLFLVGLMYYQQKRKR